MKRREFITLLGGAAAWPLATRAQQGERMREIVIWMGRPNDAEGQRHAAAFREGLKTFGWMAGRNIRTDYRWVTGDIDRARMAKEIVEQKPDVIVVETTVGVEPSLDSGAISPSTNSPSILPASCTSSCLY